MANLAMQEKARVRVDDLNTRECTQVMMRD
jgi:hypothetical protein